MGIVTRLAGTGSERIKVTVKRKKIFELVETAAKVIELQVYEVLNLLKFFLILFNPFSTAKKERLYF